MLCANSLGTYAQKLSCIFLVLKWFLGRKNGT